MPVIAQQIEQPSAAPVKNRRSQYIVNPRLQWKATITVALFVFLASSLLSSILYGVLYTQTRARIIDPVGYTPHVLPVVFGFGLAFSAVAALGAGVWCILFTHRICGPLVPIRRWLDDLAAGRRPQLRPLRKRDEWKEFHAAFCRAVESMNERQDNLARAIECMKQRQEAMAQAATLNSLQDPIPPDREDEQAPRAARRASATTARRAPRVRRARRESPAEVVDAGDR